MENRRRNSRGFGCNAVGPAGSWTGLRHLSLAGTVRERVRQIEVSAFEKVQNAVNQRVAAGAPSGQMWV
jgi:hypothetical protein